MNQDTCLSKLSYELIQEISRIIGRVQRNAYQANPDQGENLNQAQKKPNPDSLKQYQDLQQHPSVDQMQEKYRKDRIHTMLRKITHPKMEITTVRSMEKEQESSVYDTTLKVLIVC